MGVGKIYKQGFNSIQYRIQSVNDLQIIINHFDKYPLLTQKLLDYHLFKKAFYLVKNKEYLTLSGIQRILAIKASINLGLSDELKKAFPNIIPALKAAIKYQIIPDFIWLIGFVDAEGCFFIDIYNSPTTKLGQAVKLSFILTQHCRDIELMKIIVQYLGCGNIYINQDKVYLKITKFKDLTEKIIPLFEKYPLYGNKNLDFNDFCLIASIMKDKGHSTKEGLEKIIKIKAGMNRGRNK